MTLADELLARFSQAPEEKQREILHGTNAILRTKIWTPNPGPQTEAYFSKADLLLYGGQAGGGKTDLIIGLALNEHRRTGIFRQQVGELKGLMDRMDAVLRMQDLGAVARSSNMWASSKGHKIEFGHLEKPRSEYSWQGRDHDLKCFDEAAQLDPRKIIYVLGWLRSSVQGQRCRAVLASNPPLSGQGDYLLEWFGPWLDPQHPLYGSANPGELLYAFFEQNGSEITSQWCDGPEPVELNGVTRTPMSRSFIPAGLSDNPYLGESYRAQLDSLPEPMRSALLTGNFLAGRSDHEAQVIPRAFIEEAQNRWTALPRAWQSKKEMICLGVDVAQGGMDATTLAPLYSDNIFGELIEVPGKKTRDGADVASLTVKHLRSGAPVAIDMTGGWGGSAKTHLEEAGVYVSGLVASAEAQDKAKDSGIGFLNARAMWWWQFREALDPKSGFHIALPPDTKLIAELTAPRWSLQGRRIKVESKDELRARLGRSTDRADAVLMAWQKRELKDMRALSLANEMERPAPYESPFGDL